MSESSASARSRSRAATRTRARGRPRSALYIEPSRWRAGVGRALLAEALARLRAAEWSEVTLWVLAGNSPARAFYERFGFAADGAEVEHVPSGVAPAAAPRAHRLRLTLEPARRR